MFFHFFRNHSGHFHTHIKIPYPDHPTWKNKFWVIWHLNIIKPPKKYVWHIACSSSIFEKKIFLKFWKSWKATRFFLLELSVFFFTYRQFSRDKIYTLVKFQWDGWFFEIFKKSKLLGKFQGWEKKILPLECRPTVGIFYRCSSIIFSKLTRLQTQIIARYPKIASAGAYHDDRGALTNSNESISSNATKRDRKRSIVMKCLGKVRMKIHKKKMNENIDFYTDFLHFRK